MSRALCAAALASVLATTGLGMVRSAHAESPDDFKSLVAELRDKPGDMELRGRIVALAKTLKPEPREPDEVDELKGLAAAKFAGAKSPSDYVDAADAFAKVTLAAPWVGDYYLNLGLALEKAGQPRDAIANLRLYLEAEPDAPDARKVRTRIGRLRVLAEAKPAESPAPPKPAEPDLSGEWLFCVPGNPGFPPCPGTSFGTLSRDGGEYTITGNGFRGSLTVEVSGRHIELREKRNVDGYQDYSLDLSADGQTMDGTWHSVTNKGWAAECLQQACDDAQAFKLTRKSQGAAAPPKAAVGPPLDSAMAYFNRGLAKNNKKDRDGAIADYTSAIEMDPKFDSAYSLRASARLANKDYDGAIADYTSLIELNPKVDTNYFARGDARLAVKDYDGAIADYTNALEVADPKWTQAIKYHAASLAYSKRAKAKLAKKDYDGAIADDTELIGLAPADASPFERAGPYWYRAKARREKGDHVGAIADYTRVLELSGPTWDCQKYRGDEEFAKGDYASAIADWEKAIEMSPNHRSELKSLIDQARAKLNEK